jgi:hypothetical protein
MLAGCTQIGDRIAVPDDLAPPPAALLGPPSDASPSVDSRFTDALVAYTTAVHALPSYRGPEADVHIREALRLLADAVALVPGQPEIRERAYRTADALRVTAARMATDYENDPRAQAAHARQGLEATAAALLQVASTSWAGAPDVLARARSFEMAVRAIDPDRLEPDRSRVVAALAAAEDALQTILRAAINAAQQTPG